MSPPHNAATTQKATATEQQETTEGGKQEREVLGLQTNPWDQGSYRAANVARFLRITLLLLLLLLLHGNHPRARKPTEKEHAASFGVRPVDTVKNKGGPAHRSTR